MIRLVAIAMLLALLGGSVMAAATAPLGGGGRLSYTCTNNDDDKATCVCTGWFDCRQMIEDRVCRGKINKCWTPRDGSPESCSCEWRTNIMPKSGPMAPDLKMQLK